MKSSYLSLITVMLFSFALSSCATTIGPTHEYVKHITQHQGKSKDQLVNELREKYEEQCLSTDMIGFSVSRLVIVEENHLQAFRRKVPRYYYYRKKPAIQSTVDPPQMSVYLIGQQYDSNMIRFTDQDKAYDMMG